MVRCSFFLNGRGRIFREWASFGFRSANDRSRRVNLSGHGNPFGLQYAVMKPCVCNGSNDNCRYCSGSGYVPDEERLPKGIRKNPYIGMKPSTPPQLDPKIEDEIVRSILAREAERNRLEAWKEERRKGALVSAALLLVILFLVLFFRRQEIKATCGWFIFCWVAFVLAIEGWHQRREKRKSGR